MKRRLSQLQTRDTGKILGRKTENQFSYPEKVTQIQVVDRHSARRSSTRLFCSMIDRIRV